jgi:hypothetical protein
MREFYEKMYFWELERKSKIQSTLALPISVTAFGIAIMTYSLDGYVHKAKYDFVLILPLAISVLAFLYVLRMSWMILSASSYKAIWTMEQFKSHYVELVEFSREHPDAPAAEATFEENLINDLALCTTHNAVVNDRRAAALYKVHKAAFVLVLFALASAAMVIADKKF